MQIEYKNRLWYDSMKKTFALKDKLIFLYFSAESFQ